jgi:CRISPR-associated endonuclease/helicase Cas3
MADGTFKTNFKVLTGYEPFPWQIALFEEWFVEGKFPKSCNLPTGLGKTSVIAIWPIALMKHPDKMPRRLVYVVNRRMVVDQTTDEVERIRRTC